MGGFKDSNVTTLSEYDHILNINSSMYALYSYVAQYNSMVVTWTPPTSDYYTISLESEFDNYLYVIDPTNENLLVQNVDYNDDADDDTYNASLTNYYDEDITYLIIYTQYSPSSAFTNLDSGDDIILRISIN